MWGQEPLSGYIFRRVIFVRCSVLFVNHRQNIHVGLHMEPEVREARLRDLSHAKGFAEHQEGCVEDVAGLSKLG